MAYSNAKVAGALLFVAVSQFVLGLVVAEARYPGYSISANYISDLGIGPSAMVFNASVFLMGLLIIIAAYFLQRGFNYDVLTVLLVLTGIGAMGVGLFTRSIIHGVMSLIAFLFGGLSAIASYRLLKLPLSVIAAILGLMCLGALILFMGNVYLGLGKGGMERMIVYPLVVWQGGFGAYLVGQAAKP